MKNTRHAFTLIGVLLPAIGKAREQAKLTTSQSNLKQIVTRLTHAR